MAKLNSAKWKKYALSKKKLEKVEAQLKFNPNVALVKLSGLW